MPLAMTLVAGAGPATPPGALDAAGWHHAEWHGVAPARFRPLPDGGVAVEGDGEGSFVWRRAQGGAECLSWRWRVDAGPPPTDLTRSHGDDRALAVAVGFAGWPARVTFWQRSQHALAQAVAGSHPLPRSALLYVWGGTGQEPARFPSPHMAGLGMVRVLRPAATPHGRWFEERVDLAADWRAAFGGEPPPLQELAIGTDGDDTRSRLQAQVDSLRFGSCR
ncbi:DUF3047 domain-containing protein [Belnapia rosea]|uniref:DUF3047 domain-containing protein n=1 Tax=Belnapia rosea TaxID=938405 RepID=UPI00088407BC|nr:DUF3047 domain-containing protein [Belnapia rosea]SDB60582.1 Protein of unknown function [Belnapia rosea]